LYDDNIRGLSPSPPHCCISHIQQLAYLIMDFFTNPRSYRLNALVAGNYTSSAVATSSFSAISFLAKRANDHESHPALGHLMLLVFEAVLEVVCVSLPGYIVARAGMFDAENQKFVANLNVALFTPCLSMRTLCFDEIVREADKW
jgi:hypothetical protein